MMRMAIIGLMGAALASAQGGMGWAWWDSPLARDLNLSPEQTMKIRQVVREQRGRIIQLRAAVASADADLADLMRDDPFDAAKASETAERAIVARSEMTRALTQMSVRLRAVLSLDQWQELERRRPKAAGVQQPPNRPLK